MESIFKGLDTFLKKAEREYPHKYSILLDMFPNMSMEELMLRIKDKRKLGRYIRQGRIVISDSNRVQLKWNADRKAYADATAHVRLKYKND